MLKSLNLKEIDNTIYLPIYIFITFITQYYITDQWLLVKTSVVLTGVILCFFLHSFIDGMHIDLGNS